jgi:hypothetical protein
LRTDGEIVLRSKIVLPPVSLYNAWHYAGLPTLHRALLTEVAYDEDAVGEGDLSSLSSLGRQGWAALERYGLARDGQVHADLTGTLRLIADAGAEYFAFFDTVDCDFTRSALVAVSGDDAVRVTLLPDRHFALEPVRADEAAQALVAALPEMRPGSGGTISVPLDALNEKPRPQGEGGSFLQQTRAATTPQGAQVAQLHRLMAEERLGGGQLFAVLRDRFGRKQRCASPLSYLDGVGGRRLFRQAPGRDGSTWLTVQPADFGTMTDGLRHLATTVPA